METRDKPYSCSRCLTRYLTEKAYNIHIRSSLDHHVCHLCPDRKDFASFTTLQHHLEEYHFYCEPCHWFAPSALGLRQHNTSRHFLCVACGDYFLNPHELNGHAFKHRPRGVHCYCCSQDFSTLSAMYNHLESGNCPSGIEQDDIRDLAAEFVSDLPFARQFVFFCLSCQRPFRRMCDLLQHSETSACGEGYWRGSGHVGSLVTYIGKHITRSIQQSNPGSETRQGDHKDLYDEASVKLPSIVISEVT